MPTTDAVTISVQNLSTSISDDEAQRIVAALNTQAIRDYNASCWVTQKLAVPVQEIVFVAKDAAVPEGTWHMEILDTSDQQGALGYHEDEAFDNKVNGDAPPTGFNEPTIHPRKSSGRTSRGLRADAPEVPLMKIFAATSKQDGVAPSEVCSHEMLEALVDPQVVQDIRTVKKDGRIYIVEVGDPVQSTPNYEIDGFPMANFATPAYFGLEQTSNPTQYDWCHILTSPVPAMTPGGYLSWAPESEPEAWQQEYGNAATGA